MDFTDEKIKEQQQKRNNLSKVAQLVSGTATIQCLEVRSRSGVLVDLPWFGGFDQIMVKYFLNFHIDFSQEMTIHDLKSSYITNNDPLLKD